MSRAPQTPTHLDFRFAASIGNAYFELARPLLASLTRDLDPKAPPVVDASLVFSSATNIALALELYLKAIQIGLRMHPPETHDLWDLYKRLPVNTKASLESAFNAKRAALSPTANCEMQICIQRGPESAPPDEFPRDASKSNDLRALLKRSRRMFVAWRYVYESVAPMQTYAFFTFEHAHLRLACETLIEFLQRGEREALL